MDSTSTILITAHFSKECEEGFKHGVEEVVCLTLSTILPSTSGAEGHTQDITVDYAEGPYINDGAEGDGLQECILQISYPARTERRNWLNQTVAKALHMTFTPKIRIPIVIMGSEVVFLANRDCDDELFDQYPALPESVMEVVQQTRSSFSIHAKA